MNIEDLKAFVAAVDTGSIVASAKSIHSSQSSVTRRIQNLEKAFNVPLLCRDVRPLRPTIEGKEAYVVAKEILSSLHDLEGLFQHGNSLEEFHFGISRNFGDLALIQPINQLQKTYPKMKLHVSVDWSRELIEKLESCHLDAAAILLQQGDSLPDGLVGQSLTTENFLIIAPKDKRRNLSADATALSASSWVVNPKGCPIRSQLQSFLKQHRLPLRVSVEAYDVELKIALVAQGVGMGYILPHMLAMSKFRDEVDVVDTANFALRMTSWVVNPRRFCKLAGPVHCLRESLKQYLDSNRKIGNS